MAEIRIHEDLSGLSEDRVRYVIDVAGGSSELLGIVRAQLDVLRQTAEMHGQLHGLVRDLLEPVYWQQFQDQCRETEAA